MLPITPARLRPALVRSALALAVFMAFAPAAKASVVPGDYVDYYARDFGWSGSSSGTSSCSSGGGGSGGISQDTSGYWGNPDPFGTGADPFSYSSPDSYGPDPVQPWVPSWAPDPNPFFDLAPSWGDTGGGNYGSPSGDAVDPIVSFGPTSIDPSGGPTTDDPYDFVGNPLNAAIGNKVEAARDYAGHGPFPVVFLRTYNSLPAKVAGAVNSLGRNWRHNFDMNIVVQGSDVYAFRGDGAAIKFSLVNGAYQSSDDRVVTLTQLTASPTPAAWTLRTADRTVETYDTNGRLMSIVDPNGRRQTLAYDTSGRLASIADHFGRTLVLAYDSAGRLASLTGPDTGRTTYTYDANSNLTGVQYPDGTSVGYRYQDPAHANLVTSKVDGKGVTVATWTYASNGQVLTSQLAGGVATVSAAYAGTSTGVTDAAGVVRTRQYVRTATNEIRIASVSVSCADCESNLSRSVTYDSNGFVASITDFTGRSTQYTRDSQGLVLTKIDGAGTSLARTTSYTWSSEFRKPVAVTLPNNRTVSFTYDAAGNVLTRTFAAGGMSRTTTYAYNTLGQVTRITGPRADGTDVTTLTYDAQGNPASVTNSTGQTTLFTRYDALGRLLEVHDPSGKVSTASYDAMGRLASRTSNGRATTYSYDAAGLLSTVSLSNGNRLTYTYDPAHRLTDITDAAGRTLHLTLDSAGRVTRREARDSLGNPVRSAAYGYDSRDRLVSITGNNGQKLTYNYDRGYRVVSATDALNRQTLAQYDALGRITQRIDAAGGVTQFGYDANGLLASITTPRGLTTQYQRNGFGEITSIVSPETGTTSVQYDAAGNAAATTDSRAKTTTTQLDALHRPTKITYADNSMVNLGYDQGINGAGRLTSLANDAAQYTYSYDVDGALTSVQQSMAALSLSVSYSYNNKHQLAGMTYPRSGTLQFQYAADGRLASITQGLTVPVSVLTGMTFAADGQPTGWTWGNGTVASRVIDADGRWSAYSKSTASVVTIGYDAANRILGVTDSRGSSYAQGFAYDNLDRLTGSTVNSVSLGYAYDADSNRTFGPTGSFSYAPTSNRLLSGGIGTPPNLQYDAAGNVLADGVSSFTYDARGRMISSVSSSGWGTTQYLIDGFGRRVGKIPSGVAGASPTYFMYDQAGRLLGEYAGASGPYTEYIWANGVPVALLTTAGGGTTPVLYYIHTDHLGTPRQVTVPGSPTPPPYWLVWEWNGEPFGTSYPNEDPMGSGVKFTMNLRNAGQYYDKETGLFNNGFRDYNPVLGRYMQADPVGLGGGLNTYAYVSGNPISYTDPSGRCPQCLAVGAGFVVGAGAYVVGTYIGGGDFSFRDMGVAGLGGSLAVATAGEAAVGSLAIGTGRAIAGIIGDLGFDLGFNAYDAAGVLSPSGKSSNSSDSGPTCH